MDLRLYVLNVGKGLCIVIPCTSGRLTVFDIDDSKIPEEEQLVEEKLGHKRMPLTDPVEWILNNFEDQPIFRFILSHPDMDHMSGLSILSSKKTIQNFWSVPNNRLMTEEDFENSPYRFEDWEAYTQLAEGKKGNTALGPLRDANADCCWIQDGIRILSPNIDIIKEANENEDYNHSSYVLSITHSNGRRVILGGDASKASLDDLTKYYKTNFNSEAYDRLRASVLIAPHHGSKNNTSEDFLNAVNPSAIVIPVEWGADYDRDFYKKYGSVFATKTNGNICIEIRDNLKREVALWTQESNKWQIIRTD